MNTGKTSVSDLLGISMEKIKEMADVNAIIGDPIKLDDGTTIIPISKVSYGFASGGSDLPSKYDKNLFGGGAGAGVTIAPIAFIVINAGEVKLLQISPENNTADKVVGMVPELVDKIGEMISSSKKNKKPAYSRFDVASKSDE